jgi:hypothetical protein
VSLVIAGSLIAPAVGTASAATVRNSLGGNGFSVGNFTIAWTCYDDGVVNDEDWSSDGTRLSTAFIDPNNLSSSYVACRFPAGTFRTDDVVNTSATGIFTVENDRWDCYFGPYVFELKALVVFNNGSGSLYCTRPEVD